MLVRVEKMGHYVGDLPKYETEGASGFDLKWMPSDKNIKSLFIGKGCRVLADTGLKMAIPKGYELQIRSRSGLSFKRGLIVLNSPGTIDSDYRGEIKIILHNESDEYQIINPYERIAQAVLCPIIQCELRSVVSLDETNRGEGGFGSTGV